VVVVWARELVESKRVRSAVVEGDMLAECSVIVRRCLV